MGATCPLVIGFLRQLLLTASFNTSTACLPTFVLLPPTWPIRASETSEKGPDNALLLVVEVAVCFSQLLSPSTILIHSITDEESLVVVQHV